MREENEGKEGVKVSKTASFEGASWTLPSRNGATSGDGSSVHSPGHSKKKKAMKQAALARESIKKAARSKHGPMNKLNRHWVHNPPSEWPMAEHQESRDDTLLGMVNASLAKARRLRRGLRLELSPRASPLTGRVQPGRHRVCT